MYFLNKHKKTKQKSVMFTLKANQPIGNDQ